MDEQDIPLNSDSDYDVHFQESMDDRTKRSQNEDLGHEPDNEESNEDRDQTSPNDVESKTDEEKHGTDKVESDEEEKDTGKNEDEDDEEENGADKDDNISSEETVTHIPQKFSFKLTQEEWREISVQTKRDGSRKLSRNWISVFVRHTSQYIPSCPIVAKRNFVSRVNSRKRHAPFFKGLSACKFKGCLRFEFTIKTSPTADKPVKVRVKARNGDTICHDKQQRMSRPFAGESRNAAKESLRKVGPTNFIYKRLAEADASALAAGNFTEVGNKTVVQKMSSELNLEERIHKDLVTEVSITQELLKEQDTSSKHIKGFVQFFSITPFCVHLYREEQLEIFCNLVKKKEAFLYFDATGNVVQKIQGQTKPVYYYPLLVKGRNKGDPPLPVAEMITNSHATPDIIAFLMRFQRSCRLLHPALVNPQRVEVDFSFAMIHGILLAINAESPHTYIARAARIVVEGKSTRLKKKTVVHICTAHMMHLVARRLVKCCNDKGLRQFVLYVVASLIDSVMWNQFIVTYRHLCIVLLSQTTTSHPGYQAALTHLKNRIATKGGESHDDTEMPEDSDTHREKADEEEETFKESQFAKACAIVRDKVQAEMNETTKGAQNKYNSQSVLDSIQTLTGTLPLWTGLMLGDLQRHEKGSDIQTDDVKLHHDTNSPAENWMKIVKKDVLQDKKMKSPAVVIRRLHNTTTGRIIEYNLMPQKDKKERKRSGTDQAYDQEERWGKRKVKKGKYFKGTTSIPSPKKKKQTEKTTRKKQRQKTVDSKDTDTALHWGGTVKARGKVVYLSNTCPVDNLLYIVYRMAQESAVVRQFFTSHDPDIPVCGILLKIVDHFSKKEWQQGRKLWLESCCNMSGTNWDLWGSESERFVLPYGVVQETESRSTCSGRRCPRNERINRSPEILLGEVATDVNNHMVIQESIAEWESEYVVQCQAPLPNGIICRGKRYWTKRKFLHDRPPILIASVSYLSNEKGISGEFLPQEVKVLGKKYRLCAFTKTTDTRSHFLGYFRSGDNWYRYDGMHHPEVQRVDDCEIQSSTNMEHIVMVLA